MLDNFFSLLHIPPFKEANDVVDAPQLLLIAEHDARSAQSAMIRSFCADLLIFQFLQVLRSHDTADDDLLFSLC